jgi:hypothetical protein
MVDADADADADAATRTGRDPKCPGASRARCALSRLLFAARAAARRVAVELMPVGETNSRSNLPGT